MKPDPVGSTRSEISIREYFEAKLQASNEINQAYNEAQRKALELQAEEYERRFDVLRAELLAAVNSQVNTFNVFKESLAREMVEGKQTVKDKMEVLNELRRAVETDRSLFIRADKYDSESGARSARIEALERWQVKSQAVHMSVAQLETRIGTIEQWQNKNGDLGTTVGKNEARIKGMEDWRNKLLGIGVMIALFSGLVGALLMRLLAGVFGQ